MDVDAQQQAERVDKDVTLAPEDFLARILAGRIKRAPPFKAPLALCASITAKIALNHPSESVH